MSSAAPYTPAPGTVAYRVLAHLELQRQGAELMGSQIAEAIGVDPTSITPCMEPAIEAGLLFRRKRDDHSRSPWWYSLTDHGAHQPVTLAPRLTVAAPVPSPAPAAAPTAASPAPASRPAPAPSVAPRTLVGANVTLSLSGEVAVIAACGTVVLFDAERGRELLAWMAGRGAAC